MIQFECGNDADDDDGDDDAWTEVPRGRAPPRTRGGSVSAPNARIVVYIY